MPALALLPSTIASLWAGHRLWRLEQLIPRAVTGVAVGDSIAHGLRRGPLAGLLGRSRGCCLPDRGAVGGAAAHAVAGLAGPACCSRFGLLALATLLASLLESAGPRALGGRRRGRRAWPRSCWCAWTRRRFPARRSPLGAAVTVLVLLGPALALLARPARTLATALWIT